MLRRSSFIVLGAALAVLLLEVVLSCLPVATSISPVATDEREPLMHPPPRLDVVFSRGWSFEQANRAKLNNFGYRSNQDYMPADRSVAVLGDSYVESQMLAPTEALPGLLQQATSSSKVFGFGVSGASLADSLAYARWSRDNLLVDTAIVTLVAGDIAESWHIHPGLHHLQRSDGSIRLVHVPVHERQALLRAIFARSSLMRYVKLNLSFVDRFGFGQSVAEAPKFTADAPKCEERADEQEASEYLAKRFVELQNLGMRILFLLDPPRDRSGVISAECRRDIDVFAGEATQRGLHVLDLGPAFRAAIGRGTKIDYKPVDAHWNEEGHRVVAGAVSTWLEGQNSRRDAR